MKENKPAFLPLGLWNPIFKLVFNNITLHELSLFLKLCFLTDRALWFCGFMDFQLASVGLQRRFHLEVNVLPADLLVAC